MENQLEAAARQFVRDPSKVRFAFGDGEAQLSQIFKWFGQDFAGYRGISGYGEELDGVLSFCSRYLPERDRRRLLRRELDVEWLDYDWSLNTQ
jgi:hypothetical protein